jgi:hypothetical protein
MAVPHQNVFGAQGRKGQPAKNDNPDKPGKGGNPGKPGKGGKPGKQTPVPGPYDTPFYTATQAEKKAKETAAGAVEGIPAIEKQYGTRATAAQQFTDSFQNMLANQSAQTNAALQSVANAAGQGVGSGVLASQIGGDIQGADYAKRVALGKGTELKAGVQADKSQALLDRDKAYREAYTNAKADIQKSEREKQAAQIERAATGKLYGLKQSEFQYKQQQDAFKNSIMQQRTDAYIAKSANSGTNDVLSSIDKAAKAAGAVSGTEKWSGTLKFFDNRTGKYETIKIDNPMAGPTGSKAERDKFWLNYVKRTNPDVSGNIQRGGLTSTRTGDPLAVANTLVNSLIANGQATDAASAQALILQTSWGMANPKAVRAAFGS